jgi:hypothetical protein
MNPQKIVCLSSSPCSRFCCQPTNAFLLQSKAVPQYLLSWTVNASVTRYNYSGFTFSITLFHFEKTAVLSNDFRKCKS